jgi:hypothetical protein
MVSHCAKDDDFARLDQDEGSAMEEQDHTKNDCCYPEQALQIGVPLPNGWPLP